MKQLLFTYGSLCRNSYNNYLLDNEHCKFIREELSPPIYTMYGGGFPIVERKGNTAIWGELWEVTSKEVLSQIMELEQCTGIKGHPDNWYDIDFINFDEGDAIIFVMNKSNNDVETRVRSGKWR